MKPFHALLVSTLCACTPAAPDEAGFPAAAAIAREVVADNVTRAVEELSNGHANDVKVSCSGYEVEDGFPACELSRDAAVAYVSQSLAGFGYDPRVVALGADPEALNVVAERPGTTLPGELVVVAAHLDAFYSGADDDSSGVAALLETARIVSTRSFSRTIRFVVFDLEEYGSVGSARYVAAGLANDVVFAIVLDCVGFATDAPGSQEGLPGLSIGDVGDFLMVVANGDSIEQAQRILALNHSHGFMHAKGIAAGGDGWFPLTSALTRSDNGPLWLQRIPSVMFTDTADLRNPHYHRADDVPSSLRADFLTGATRLSVASVALFAEPSP